MTSKQQEQLDKYIDAVVEEAIYSHDQEMMKKLVERFEEEGDMHICFAKDCSCGGIMRVKKLIQEVYGTH